MPNTRQGHSEITGKIEGVFRKRRGQLKFLGGGNGRPENENISR